MVFSKDFFNISSFKLLVENMEDISIVSIKEEIDDYLDNLESTYKHKNLCNKPNEWDNSKNISRFNCVFHMPL